MGRLQKKGFVRDEAEGKQRLKELQGEIIEDSCREQRRSPCEESRSYVQEEITVKEVEEWILSAATADLEWLFRCRGSSEQERTYKYFQLFSVKHKEGDGEYVENFFELLLADGGRQSKLVSSSHEDKRGDDGDLSRYAW